MYPTPKNNDTVPTTPFIIIENKVYHLNKPNFYVEFSLDEDDSIYYQVRGREIFTEEDMANLPQLTQLACDTYKKHIGITLASKE